MTTEMIEVFVNGHKYPALQVPFIKKIIENATDNVTLGGIMYTDYMGKRRSWELTWKFVCAADYATILADYEWQFENNSYVIVDIPAFGLYGIPMRMYIGDSDIRRNGDEISDIGVRLVEQEPYS